jgi:hypothetical protein
MKRLPSQLADLSLAALLIDTDDVSAKEILKEMQICLILISASNSSGLHPKGKQPRSTGRQRRYY